MKHKLTKIKLLVVATLLLLLSSCEKDLYENAEVSQYKIQQVKLSDLPFLQNAIASKKRKQRLTGNEIDYLSLIKTDNIKLIEDEYGGKSFTFSLNLEEENKLTNLVIKQYGQDFYYKLVEYQASNFEQWQEDIKNDQASAITPTVEIKDLESRLDTPCIKVAFTCPTPSHHTNGFDCNQPFDLWIYAEVLDGDCNDGDGTPTSAGGGGAPHETGGGGGGSSSSSNSSPNNSITVSNQVMIMTTPVHGAQVSPCVKMKSLLADLNLKGRLNVLKGAADQWSFEDLFVVNPNPSPTTNNSFNFVQFTGSISDPNASWSGDTTMKGIIHSHFDGLLSVFSPADLQTLYNIMSNENVTDDFFYGVVTKAGTKYVITINNRDAFLAFGSKYLSSDGKYIKFNKEIWQNKYNIQIGNGMGNQNELAFTKMMGEMNMGVNLFALSADCSTSEQLKYVPLNSVVGLVKKTNCN